ncbi:MAG: PHP domain-containing protein [Deferrisomatales bacterium]
MVDLHVHTTRSDGALTPTQAVRYAAARGLRAVAVTDHDTIDGNEEASAAGRAAGVDVVAGVEISTQWDGITFHLLGYGLKRVTPRVREAFAFLVESRCRRNPEMLEKLRRLGIDLTMEEVAAEARGEIVGRPHFAQALVRRGVVGSTQEAFARFLGRGAPAYVDKNRLSPAQACELIREARGLAVLAHPGLIEQDRPGALHPLVEHLEGLGLAGIEAYYSRHSADQVSRYRSLARRKGLLVTGGSDFHRSGEGGPEMGTGFGDLRVPDSCYEELVARLGAPSR